MRQKIQAVKILDGAVDGLGDYGQDGDGVLRVG